MTTGRPPAITYEMGGHQFTCRQLAELAGCSAQAMGKRLERGMSAADAVSWGPAKQDRPRPHMRGKSSHNVKHHRLGGEVLTAAQLAERAGCPVATMVRRLRDHKPEDALALGPANSNRPRKTDFRIKPERAPKPEPTKTRPASSDALSASDWRAAEVKKDKRKLPASLKVSAPSGEIFIPPGLEIQRAAPIPDRFAVDPATCPPIFSGRPYGVHEDTGTAIARCYGGGA